MPYILLHRCKQNTEIKWWWWWRCAFKKKCNKAVRISYIYITLTATCSTTIKCFCSQQNYEFNCMFSSLVRYLFGNQQKQNRKNCEWNSQHSKLLGVSVLIVSIYGYDQLHGFFCTLNVSTPSSVQINSQQECIKWFFVANCCIIEFDAWVWSFILSLLRSSVLIIH